VIHLVVYDIASSSRREDVANVLAACGARVQLSVFEIEVPGPLGLVAVLERLRQLIDEDEDQVRVYGVRSGAAVVLGNRELEERRDFWIL